MRETVSAQKERENARESERESEIERERERGRERESIMLPQTPSRPRPFLGPALEAPWERAPGPVTPVWPLVLAPPCGPGPHVMLWKKVKVGRLGVGRSADYRALPKRASVWHALNPKP